MKIQACIFDLDGVIVDTARFHFIAWKQLADALSIPFNEHDNEQLKGVSRMTSLEIILRKGNKNYSDAEKLEMAGQKNRAYLQLCETLTEADILPGVISFLDALQNHNIRIGLGSASKNAVMILDKLKLTSRFQSIADGNKIHEAKPNPQVFLKAAEELRVTPEHAVVFEDAEAGIEAALRGGFYAVGIGSREILHRAHRVLSSTQELGMEVIENLS